MTEQELKSLMIDDLVEKEGDLALENGDSNIALRDIYRNGFKGFNQMSMAELKEEYEEQCGPISEIED